MKTAKKTLVAFLSVGAATAGCAKQENTLSEAEAKNAGLALAAGVEDGAAQFGPITTAQFDAGCIVLSGDGADLDGDNIPASATLTLNCTDTRFGYTGMVTGTLMVTDDQPDAIAWAFTGLADLRSSLTAPSGASLTNERSGQLVGTQSSPTGPFQLARNLDVTTTFRGANGATVAVDESTEWMIEYTPQITWRPGEIVVGGSLTASGMWNITVGNRSASATVATPTALTVTPGCATRVTGGTVTGTYQGGGKTNTISVSWTGCGQSAVTFTQS